MQEEVSIELYRRPPDGTWNLSEASRLSDVVALDSIGCRIKIDDVVKDERTVNALNAFTYCLDKSG